MTLHSLVFTCLTLLAGYLFGRVHERFVWEQRLSRLSRFRARVKAYVHARAA